LPSMELTSRYR